MRCKDCNYFYKIANTDKTHQGVCHYPNSWFPVREDIDCIFLPKSYTCADCSRLGNDFACVTKESNDSAYNNGHLCCGFIDKHEDAFNRALEDWSLRGYDIDKKVKDLVEKFKKEFKSPLC